MENFLFLGIDDNKKAQIQKRLNKPIKFEAGNELYRCGELGILVSGSAKVIRNNDSGTVTMRNIKSGDIFGAASLFGEWKEEFSSIVSVSVVTVIYISEDNLCELFKDYPEISLNYIKFLTGRVRFLNRKIDTFSADNTQKRIYEFLSDLADENGKIVLDYGMAELARRLKIGRSSLYRSITALEKNGLIIRKNKIFYII